jgi:hypothetical protein
MKKIILVGCGNIGSRHLQALMKFQYPLQIEIVENYEPSIILAKSRLDEINNNKIHTINWHNNFEFLSGFSDLVIVATLSSGRVKIIESLLNLGYKKFLIEKLVCQSIEEYDNLLDLVKKFDAKGWVNTRCRYFKSYRKIKDLFKNTEKINLKMSSGDTGLATGAIHYLDLFSWLLDDNKIKLNGELLDPKIYPNKRGKNLIEFGGTISGSAKNNSSVSISFSPGIPSLLVSIDDGMHKIILDEYNEKILYNSFNEKLDFKLEHISNITTQIVEDILKNDDCLLPTIDESYLSHVELFKIFSKHLEKIKKEKVKLCPIT